MKIIPTTGMSIKRKTDAMKEFSYLQLMKSPYVLNVYQCFEEEDNLYIICEYCEIGDLQSIIKSAKEHNRNIEESYIIRLAIAVSEGLKYLHSKDLAHRDIKPANVFLKTGGVIKIGDFGIAQHLENRISGTKAAGTPAYSAPEILNTFFSDKERHILSLSVHSI